MNTTSKILLVVWIILLIDSTIAMFCSWNNNCINFYNKLWTYFSTTSRFNLKGSWWPIWYFILSILGLLTIICCSK